MADTTFRDQLNTHRRCYAAMRTKRARGCFLDRLQDVMSCSRKYLIRLLRGKRNYRPPRGRSPSYGEAIRKEVLHFWEASGNICAEYLKVRLPKLVADAAKRHPVAPGTLEELLRMSASTLGRIIRQSPEWRKNGRQRNRRSGSNPTALKASIPACPGSDLPEAQLGTCQMDSVMLCGGTTAGSYFSIVTLTDALTQWFECASAWNHGAAATDEAIRAILARLPFVTLFVHSDNGPEFINYLFQQSLKRLCPQAEVSRSRPYRKNDNARIEQKNGSVVRVFFRDLRVDNPGLQKTLEVLCRDIALYTNLFVPSKKLRHKELLPGRGVRYRKIYDAPATPLERLKRIRPDDARVHRYEEIYETTNSIDLLQSIRRRIKKIEKLMTKGASAGGHAPRRTPLVKPPPSFGAHAFDRCAPNPSAPKSLFGAHPI